MPVYEIEGKGKAGFAARFECPMLYIMDTALLDEFAVRPGKACSGNSCIGLEATQAPPLPDLGKLALAMLTEPGRRV
jgi:hypothetical protein